MITRESGEVKEQLSKAIVVITIAATGIVFKTIVVKSIVDCVVVWNERFGVCL